MRPAIRLSAQDGFTLIELLVVVLIIGVLAAVALPSFLAQRSKAQDAEAKVYLVAAHKALEVWHTEHGDYRDASVAGLEFIEPALARMRNAVLTTTDDTFEVSLDSASNNGGKRFGLAKDEDANIVRTCENPGHGACPASGRW
jgi:type IV pilus assembly protein PilA